MTSSQTPPPPIDMYLSALACACTVVATLRAGSRLCYMATHGGRIGQIDGPPILGPSDVEEVAVVGVDGVDEVGEGSRVRAIGDEGDSSESSSSSRAGEISPLWEVAYAFERAVRFSLDDDDLGDDGPAVLAGSSSSPSRGSESSVEAGRGDGGVGVDLVATEVAVPLPYLMSPFGVVRSDDRLLIGDVVDGDEEDDDEDQSSESSESDDVDDDRAEVVEGGGGGDVPGDDDDVFTSTMIPPQPPPPKETTSSFDADDRGIVASSLGYPRRFGRALWSAVPSASSVRSTANFLVIRPLHRLERGATSVAWGAYSSLASSWRRGQGGRLWWPSSVDKSLRSSDFAGSKSKTIVLPPVDTSISSEVDGEGESDGEEGNRRLRRRRGRVARITAYAPHTFHELRTRCFGVDDVEFERAMSGPFVSFQSNSKGAARAGGYFFFSRDGAYMIKYIKRTEAGTFLRMMPRYHRHMRRNGRRSLLTRICGMYEVRLLDAVVEEEVDVDCDDDGTGKGGRPPR